MKKILVLIAGVVIGCMATVTIAKPAHQTAEGYWKTVDDVTKRVKSIIYISKNKQTGALQGKIVKTYPSPDEKPLKICKKCKGERHNKPILGMTILTDLRPDKKTNGLWVDGNILDPRNGKTYHCTVRLKDHNKKLSVRGYIGIPLFGRSQVWLRTASAKG